MKTIRYLCFIGLALGIFTQTTALEKAIPFALRNIDGELVNVGDYLGKQPMVVDFWATWCKPCVKSLPELQKIHREFKASGLVVLAVNEDGPRSLSKVAPFAKSQGLSLPVLLDEKGDVLNKYQASGLPTTVLINREGEIVLTLRGYRPGDDQKLRTAIKSLMEAHRP